MRATPRGRGRCGLPVPRLLLLVATVASGATATFTCAAANDATACSALGDLYTATNGAGWVSNTGWRDAAAGTATDCCTFQGVTCAGGVVTQLCVRRRMQA